MDIKLYIENLLLLQEETTAVVVEISKVSYTGNDILEYNIVCENYTQRYSFESVYIDGVSYSFSIFDTAAITAQQDFTDTHYVNVDTKMYVYQTQVRDIIYGGYNNEWNMLEHEILYKQYIKAKYNSSDPKGIIRGTNYRPGDFYIHYYIILSIYDNGIVEITEEMSNDIYVLYTVKDQRRDNIIDWVISQLDLVEVVI